MSSPTLPFTPSPHPDTEGIAQAEDAADTAWWSTANAALDFLAATGRQFTADDLTAIGVPAPEHPSRWGALFASASRAHRIERVAAARSARGTRRGGLLLQWVGAPTGRAS
jgi:hypothetical protein